MKFKYEINSNNEEVTLIGVEGECPKELNIPEHINIAGRDYKVTAIMFGSLFPLLQPEYGSGVTCDLIRFPNTVNSVFLAGNNVKEVFLPETLSKIEWACFQGCKKLKIVHIPYGLTLIEFGAFEGCSSLKEIVIPPTVNEIESSCFKNCSSLESISLPSGISTLNESLFENCVKLREVIIENQDTTFYPSTYKGCENIQKIENHIIEDGLLYNLDKTELYTYLGGHNSNGHIVVSESVREIGNGFADSANLISIDLSRTQIKTIYQETFQNCTNLKKVILPSTIKVIEDRAFLDCIQLYEINLPDYLEEIGVACFSGCALAETHIPDSLTEIPQSAFHSCDQLKKVHIPLSIKSIDRSAFENCINLQQVTISEGFKNKVSQIFEQWYDIDFTFLDVVAFKRTGAHTYGHFRPCPYCGSNNVHTYHDGTAECNTCKGEYTYQ